MGSSRLLHELELLPLKPSSHNAPSLCTSRHSHLTPGTTERYTAQSCVSRRTKGDPFAHRVRARISIDVNLLPSCSESEDELAKEAPPFICSLSHNTHASGNAQNCASSHQNSGHDRPLGHVSPRASKGEDGALIARKKLRLSKEKSAVLEERFKEHSTLNPKQKIALANRLNLQPRQVEVWFQNRRARTKLKQMELDCDTLNRCCEALSEENRQLQKEIAELRALSKAGQCVTCHGLCMPFPGTAFTMGSSCKCHTLQRIIALATSTTTSISSFDQLSNTS